MEFSDFEKQIVKITKMELPGEAYHLKMAPIERLLELKQKARYSATARKAGVMVLFYPSESNETHLILILRKTYKGVHSAQVGFPGGKIEPEDESLQHAALRECEEEVGVPSEAISVLKKMTEIYIPPSNFFVQPYLGITAKTPRFIPQEDEVEALIEVPLQQFLDDSVRITKTLSTSYATNIEVPAFLLQDHVVWGATAMMLNEVRQMLKELL
ncbi:MAG: CoA pyrophosphatase [Flavobacteriales bacterium]|jgi:8-oxo-dGTP pyrophosphatase MutT (NUDIX family)|uniref:NUDIX hydrolase n=1 Tax=Candidatus Ulvibacter alkanivorans TaxID=2267620 RepID=UPI000DF28218|nr:CoA pyrophosphatase [Candidatus Ulvibacter alkanivorans]MCH2488754.1 CoA pyrophosphatase [Flavobacteriales bacterium]